MPPSLAFRPRFQVSAVHLARLCALASVMTGVAPVCAQPPPGQGGSGGSSWGLGVAVISAQKAYKGVERETSALPMLSFENRYAKLTGPNLELKLPGRDLGDSQRLNFGVVAKLFGDGGYEAGDSPTLAGMAERESGVWAGAKMAWENDWADVKLEVLGDAAGKSNGQRVVLGFERQWMVSPEVMLVPQVGVEWVSARYVDYYYGVRAGEATAGRAAYVGKAALNPEISLAGIYRFDEHHSLMLNVGMKALDKEIEDSPIVGRSTENRVMLGYLYRF